MRTFIQYIQEQETENPVHVYPQNNIGVNQGGQGPYYQAPWKNNQTQPANPAKTAEIPQEPKEGLQKYPLLDQFVKMVYNPKLMDELNQARQDAAGGRDRTLYNTMIGLRSFFMRTELV